MKTLRNGDYVIKATTDKVPKEATLCKHNGSYCWSIGMATNHSHTLVADKPKDMKVYKLPDNSYMVITTSEVKITHPEHSLVNDLILPKGTYRLYQKREKDWFSLVTRRVID